MLIMVTGASAGFGEAISHLLIENGHTVIGTGRREERLKALQEKLGEKFIPLSFDICSQSKVEKAFLSLSDEFKDIDILVNNAGLALGLEAADKANIDDWQQMIDTNVTGLCNITNLVLPIMVKKNSGLIINMGSIAGTYPYPGGNVYGATKAFVKQFSLNLRADLKDTKVRVSNIEPGLCSGTEFSSIRFKGDEAAAQNLYKNVDAITPIDIANIVLWLAGQPEHININSLEVMPTAQTFSPLYISRR
ncbi:MULTISPECIES: SDR family NAD(P)-dependent oxidoreductase [Psychrobacter]|uniref:SDR family NAD(P)-dependent oxidoreductase n=1 Tax=Psychrobacter TaxID=497 RepID=UPI000EE914CC|nr:MULTISPECIES: SDR family NAD(P)-dependent oxidoreductase [Psychrobacter]HCT73374.1 NADP-dependent 3-hydroxy acid dehydrogenase [Psychrobacter sp.]